MDLDHLHLGLSADSDASLVGLDVVVLFALLRFGIALIAAGLVMLGLVAEGGSDSDQVEVPSKLNDHSDETLGSSLFTTTTTVSKDSN